MTSTHEPHHPALRRNALASVVGRIGSVILWVGVTPVALRYLGQERFGIWSLFMVLSGSVVSLDFGMWSGVSRFVAMANARGERREARSVVFRGLILSLVLGLFWALVLVLCRGLFLRVFNVPAVWHDEVRRGLLVFAGALILQAASLVFQGALTGLQRLDLWNVYFLIGLAANAAVLLTGLARGAGLVATAWAAASGSLVSSTLAAFSVRACLRRLPNSDPARHVSWRELLNYGVVVQMSNALGMAQFQWAAKVMLGVLGRLAWVTPYELGFRVTNSLWSLPTLLQVPVVPAAAHASATGGERSVIPLYEWCCRWVITATACAMGGLWLLAPPLFRLWLGPGHEEAVATVRWLTAALALSSLAGPATAVARGYGWPELEAINFAIALVVNVAVGVVLIPHRGAVGAAMAMTASFVVASAWLMVTFHRRLHLSTGAWLMRWVAPRYLPAIAITLLLQLVVSRVAVDSRWASIALVGIGGAVYTALYVAATWRTGDPQAVWSRGVALIRRDSGARIDPATLPPDPLP